MIVYINESDDTDLHNTHTYTYILILHTYMHASLIYKDHKDNTYIHTYRYKMHIDLTHIHTYINIGHTYIHT